MSNSKNPYASAAGAYDTNARTNAGNQRETEARILMKANRMMQELLNNWENQPKGKLEDVLIYNRQIWIIFYDTAIENKEGDRPNDLRSNIINLANFIFKREMEILAAPTKQKFDVLININTDISAGLMTQVAGDATQDTPQKADSAQRMDISG